MTLLTSVAEVCKAISEESET